MVNMLVARIGHVRWAMPALVGVNAVLLVAGLLAVATHDDDGGPVAGGPSVATTTTTTALSHEEGEPPAVDPAGPPSTQAPVATTTPPPTIAAAPSRTCTGSAATAEGQGLWMVDTADARLRRVTTEIPLDPKWSPDGKRLAYVVGDDGAERLVVFDVDGASRTLYDKRPVRGHTGWTADSAKVVFAAERTPSMDTIFALPVGGGEATPLYEARGDVSYLAVRPDGSIVFIEAGEVVLVDADGSDRRVLIARVNTPKVDFIRLSPDGSRVAYGSSGPYGVVTVADGVVKHLGTVDDGVAIPLTWADDGSRLAFFMFEDDVRILVTRPDGSDQRTLTKAAKGAYLAPSGKEVAWTAESLTLTATDLATGAERVLGANLEFATWKPTGDALSVFSRPAKALCLLGSTSMKRLARVAGDGEPWGQFWSPTGATLAFVLVTGASGE